MLSIANALNTSTGRAHSVLSKSPQKAIPACATWQVVPISIFYRRLLVANLRRRFEGVMVREVDDGVLLLDTESNQIHQLNQTAKFVWSACDEVASVEQITALLAEEFEVEAHAAAKDVDDVVERLLALNLVIEVSTNHVSG